MKTKLFLIRKKAFPSKLTFTRARFLKTVPFLKLPISAGQKRQVIIICNNKSNTPVQVFTPLSFHLPSLEKSLTVNKMVNINCTKHGITCQDTKPPGTVVSRKTSTNDQNKDAIRGQQKIEKKEGLKN